MRPDSGSVRHKARNLSAYRSLIPLRHSNRRTRLAPQVMSEEPGARHDSDDRFFTSGVLLGFDVV